MFYDDGETREKHLEHIMSLLRTLIPANAQIPEYMWELEEDELEKVKKINNYYGCI